MHKPYNITASTRFANSHEIWIAKTLDEWKIPYCYERYQFKRRKNASGDKGSFRPDFAFPELRKLVECKGGSKDKNFKYSRYAVETKSWSLLVVRSVWPKDVQLNKLKSFLQSPLSNIQRAHVVAASSVHS